MSINCACLMRFLASATVALVVVGVLAPVGSWADIYIDGTIYASPYTLTTGTLTATVETVGSASNGTLNQTGGLNSASCCLTLGFPVGITGTYNLSGGTLTVSFEAIGSSGVGTFNQTSGSNTATGGLLIGDASGGMGTYTLSGGTLSATAEEVGNPGTGLFVQTGGTNTVGAGGLGVGHLSGSTGTYTLSAGTLNISTVLGIGNSGTGAFNLSGGTINFAANAGFFLGGSVGEFPGGTGTFNLNSGSLTAYFEAIGNFANGTGTFNQLTGTTNTVLGNLTLGSSVGTTGTYNMVAGTLTTVGNENIGLDGTGTFTQTTGTNTIQNGNGLRLGIDSTGSGTYAISGGTLSAGFLTIGRSGTGTFTENGGTVNIGGNLLMGNGGGGTGVGGTGTLNLNGGKLNIGSGFIGNVPESTGTVTIAGSGALNASSTLTIGVSGQGMLTLQDTGSLTVSGNGVVMIPGFLISIEDIGSPGTGSVLQTGGTNTILNGFGMRLGIGAIGSGTYTIDGGTLSTAFLTIGRDGTGTFTENGGTVNVAGGVFLGNNTGASGTLNLNGGSFSSFTGFIGSNFNGLSPNATGTVTVNGPGSWTVTAGNLAVGEYAQGTLTIQNGGAVTATSGSIVIGDQAGAVGTVTMIGASSQLNVTGGIFNDIYVGNAGTGTFNLGGGTVTVNGLNAAIIVGYVGSGALIQTGGTIALANGNPPDGLDLGFTSTGIGAYTISGGSLTTGFIHVGQSGTGTFTQNGGAVTIGPFGGMAIGYLPGSTGTYNLNAGSLTLMVSDGIHSENVGYDGTGIFIQTGGANTILGGGNLLLAADSVGSNGIYTLSGGTLSIEDGGSLSVGRVGTGTFTQNGGTVNVIGTVYVGSAGVGTLNLSGGTITSGGGVIGNLSGSVGAATVTGPGSWTITTDTFEVGELGQGTLTITNGGKVAWGNGTNGVVLGDQTGSTGTATVTGTGSLLNFIALEVGGSGLGTLTVQNGGEAFGLNGITIGSQKGSVGSVTVTGAGSSLQSAYFGPLYVGNSGQGTLLVQQGASVTTGSIYVGEFGQGALIVESGGVVSNQIASNMVVLGDQAGSVGTVVVTDAGSQLNAAGLLTVGGSGQGALTVQNGGLVLASSITIGPFGQVTLSNGTLDPTATTSMIVQTGGVLRGHGTVQGALTNNGTVAPGGTGRMLAVTGNYIQTTSGTLAIEAAPTTTSTLAVGGSATLAGTLSLTFDPGTYAPGKPVTILTSSKGVSGTFGTLTYGGANLGLLVPTVIYKGFAVDLHLVIDPLPDFAATPNQFAVATTLQQAMSTATGGDLVTVFNVLNYGTPAQLQAAYTALSGTAYTALPTVAINTLDAAAAVVFGHWDGTGTGFAGARMLPVASFSGNGWMPRDSMRPTWWTGAVSGPQASPDLSGFPALSGSDSGDALTTTGSGFWSQSLNGSMGVTGWGDSLASANAQTSGTLMGYDSVLSPSLRIGTALGHWQSGLTMNDGTGQSTAVSTGLVAAYAQYSFGDWVLDTMAGYTSDTGQVSRPLAFLGRLATAAYTSNDMIVAAQAGPRLHWGGMTVLPTFGVHYVQATLPTVTEGGAGSLDLTVAGQTVTSVRGVVGLRVSAPDTGGTFGWTAYVNYGHEFGASTFSTTATLAGAPGNPFTVTGVTAPADTWGAGVGLNWRPWENTEVRLTYDALLSAPQSSQAGAVTFDWHF